MNPNYNFLVIQDDGRLPLSRNSIDYVMILSVLHHIPTESLSGCLKEFQRGLSCLSKYSRQYFDHIVSITIGSIIASLVVDRSINAIDSIIATAVWCVLPIIVGYNLFFRKIVDSEPLIIINGTILKVYYIYVSKKTKCIN